MATEQGLYTQGVMLRRKYLNITEENKDKNEDKFKFQGQSARSQRWFDLGFYLIEKNSAHVNLISIRKYFKGIIKHKIKIHFKRFYFQS